MKKQFIYSALFALLSIANLSAQQKNWAEHIAPILYQNCTSCHHTGGLGGFNLITYNDAASMASAVKNSTTAKRMPPWPPSTNYRRYAHERLLTDQQIADITNWADNGAPQGNPSLAPTVPTYNNLPTFTSPSMVAKMPDYRVSTNGEEYRCFVIPANNSTIQYITGLEVIPGNPSAVHHVLIFQDTSTYQLNRFDAADPQPGYINLSQGGTPNAKLIGGWVPGSRPFEYPTGFGIKLEPRTNIILQVHYPAGSLTKTDSTKVLFKMTPAQQREITVAPAINHIASLIGGPLDTPANQVKSYTAQYTLPNVPLSALSVLPHMHLIGKSMKVYAITPTTDTIPLIYIPSWDFKWQGQYFFKKLQQLPPRTKLRAEAVYDNTSNNPRNPNNPPRRVTAGEATTDEMMICYFALSPYFPGDENIEIEPNLISSTEGANTLPNVTFVSTIQLYQPSPNPTTNQLNVECFIPKLDNQTNFYITDASGKTIWKGSEKPTQVGFHQFKINTTPFATGTYHLHLKSNNGILSKSFIKE